MTTRHQNIIGALVGLMLVCGAVGWAAFYYLNRPRQIVSNLLRLETPPASLRNVQCESWSMTDVLTTCAFEIDPADFPALLSGWQFTERRASGGSYSFAGGPRLGVEFPVAVEFHIMNSTTFRRGGRVSLVADASRSRAQVDYYEE